MSKIEVRNMSFSYDKEYKNIVLDNVNFSIKDGESVGIIGANGVGKSTLLKLLVGLQIMYKGDILVGDYRVDKKHLKDIRKNVGYVFQDSDSQLFMSTVYEDIAFGPRNEGMTGDKLDQVVKNAATKVHVENLLDNSIYKLSGGQKKATSIATVLVSYPEVILLDEPSVALDPRNRRNLIRVINELETTKVITSHDLDFIYDTCERTIVLFDGHIVYDGDTKKILRDKDLLEQYNMELPLSFSRINE